MHFYADVEVYLRYAGQVKDGDHKVGELVQAIVERSRLRPGPNKAKFRILYDRGIDDVYGVIATLLDLKVIEQSGSWYTFTPIGRVQGEQALYNALYQNPEVYLAARNLVLGWQPELTGNLKIAEPEK